MSEAMTAETPHDFASSNIDLHSFKSCSYITVFSVKNERTPASLQIEHISARSSLSKLRLALARMFNCSIPKYTASAPFAIAARSDGKHPAGDNNSTFEYFIFVTNAIVYQTDNAINQL